MGELPDDIHMLSQPLMTEEGFVNPACINELENVLCNMPHTYERLKDNSEWSTPEVVNVKQITGYFAHWAIRNLQNIPFPPNLEKLVGFLDACIRKEFSNYECTEWENKESEKKWHESGWCHLSLCQINKMLWEILEGTPEFDSWNTEECLGRNWLDLDALLHNVCISIHDEARAFKAFNKEFDEEHGNKFSREYDI